MGNVAGELISEKDRDDLTEAAYKMQSAYQTEKTLFDAVEKVRNECPTVNRWQLEGMWRAIDAYCDLNT